MPRKQQSFTLMLYKTLQRQLFSKTLKLYTFFCKDLLICLNWLASLVLLNEKYNDNIEIYFYNTYTFFLLICINGSLNPQEQKYLTKLSNISKQGCSNL